MKNNGIAAVTTVLCIAILGACFSEWDGGYGNAGITPGDKEPGVEPPWMQGKGEEKTGLKYTVTIKRNGKVYDTYGPLTYVEFNNLQIPLGTWDIELWIDGDDWTEMMKGTGQETVRAGVVTKVEIIIEEPSTWEKFERECGRSTEQITVEKASFTLGEDGVPKTLTLDGSKDAPKKIILKTLNGPLFVVPSDCTLELKDITLQGHDTNTAPLVEVTGEDAKLFMENGAKVTGNYNKTTSNGEDLHGGGIRVTQKATFTMNGGDITGNYARDGAGVKVNFGAKFIMNGGAIYKNHADTTKDGTAGGVHIWEGGTLTMHGGEIYENTATGKAGGIYIGGLPGQAGSLTKEKGKGAEIKGNTSTTAGQGNQIYASEGDAANGTKGTFYTRDNPILDSEELVIDKGIPQGTLPPNWTTHHT